MNNTFKNIVAVGLVVGVVAFGLFWVFGPKQIIDRTVTEYIEVEGNVDLGAAGDSFTVQKIASEVADFSSTTQTSLYNFASSSRFISQIFCAVNLPEPIDLGSPDEQGWLVHAATSSTEWDLEQGAATTTDFAMNGVFATTSGKLILTASSSIASPQAEWAAGTYLNFMHNKPTSTITGLTGNCGAEYWQF